MFAIRYHHTERRKRCKAAKWKKRLFFPCFSNFFTSRRAGTAFGRFAGPNGRNAPQQVDW